MSQLTTERSVDRPTQQPNINRNYRRGVTSEPRKVSLLGDAAEDFAAESMVKAARSKSWLYLSPFARVRICAFVITIFAAAVILKLFTWQIEKQTYLQEKGSQLRVRETTIASRRGLIMDSNGLVLAANTWVYNVYGAPKGLSETQSARIADKLSRLLPSVPQAKIRDAITYSDPKKTYNLIAAAIDTETANKIKEASLPGVVMEAKSRRTYPNGPFLGTLLGFTNFEGQGAYGIEGRYDKELSGKPGTRLAEFDADGNPIVLGQINLKPAQDGVDVSLTIDSSIQFIVERELKKGLEDYKAESGLAIVADPQTGAILAWASFPNYDPNEFYKTDPKLLRDPMVSDLYEPGSTFKILTAAIGIDTGVVTPDSAANLPGCIIKYGQTICNHNKVGYANQTVVKTLQESSNVGAMWIAEKFGADKYYEYLRKFGFGIPTGIDVSGEAQGMYRTRSSDGWSPLDFLTNSFGQSVLITPVQLIQAVSAVANGGKLMKPYVVAKVTREGQTIEETTPQVVRQVISPEAARTTTNMLVNAVRLGETRLAQVKGYRVAGKTGTSTLYTSNRTVGSTIAYAPADNPRFIVLVRYDKPTVSQWGSNTAAPVVSAITEQLFVHFKIPPTEPVK